MSDGSKNQGVHVQEYVYDFEVDGGAAGAFDLSGKSGKSPVPNGAIIKQVSMKVVTAFAGGTSLAWVNGDDADGYSVAVVTASLTDSAVFNGHQQAAVLLWDDTNHNGIYVDVADSDDGKMECTIAGTMTAGKAIFMVEYYYPSLS